MKRILIDLKDMLNAKSLMLSLGFGTLFMSSCTVDPNSPGVEYMPDM